MGPYADICPLSRKLNLNRVKIELIAGAVKGIFITLIQFSINCKSE